MRITTRSEARDLVGRTFERHDGEVREVVGVTGGKYIDFSDPDDDVVFTDTFKAFSNWLSGAKEITE